MSKAEELLNNAFSSSDVALFANVPDEAHIVIGSDRYITVPKELKRLAVQWDHDIETVTFDCPRYWDDHDMSQMHIYVNYLRSDGESGVFKAENIKVDETDSSIMHFDWTISRNATEVIGKLIFLVCVKCADEDGKEKNHWNSELCKDCYVSEGLEVDETFEELYADVILQWEKQVTDAIDDINAVKNNLITMRDSGEFDGATFTPSTSSTGDLSWTNDKGKVNPPTVNIRGLPGVSPTIQVETITGGHKVTVTDVNGVTSFTVMDTIIDATEATKEMLNQFVYVGSDEPTFTPSLWFDTDPYSTEGT